MELISPLTNTEDGKQPQRRNGAPVFRRLVALLDGVAPQAALVPALEWARRLHLPLTPLLGPDIKPTALCGFARNSFETKSDPAAFSEAIPWTELPSLSSTDLVIFVDTASSVQKRNLLDASWGDHGPAILICPNVGEPLNRVLLLDEGYPLGEHCLRVAEEICRALRAKLVVLTVARSVREAQLRQQAAKDTCVKYGLDSDFDLVVGSNPAAAVASVARWRRCQLVMVDRRPSPAWWRWRDPSSARTLSDRVQSFAVLSLPVKRSLASSSSKVNGHVDR